MAQSQAGDWPPGVDPATPSPARMYNYILGGEHHYQVDREAAERFREQMPDLMESARANRGFHGRAAIWLAERGIRQFIDIGAGLPVPTTTHRLVHKVAPRARVAYVDIDPLITVLASELQAPGDTTVVIEAEVYQQATQSAHPRGRAEVARFFDGLEIVPPWPGAQATLTHPGLWAAEDGVAADTAGSSAFYCAVARCP
jgi:hypothetical protein